MDPWHSVSTQMCATSSSTPSFIYSRSKVDVTSSRMHITTQFFHLFLQPNLLTPGTKLDWRECAELPFAMRAAQVVVIAGIVYVGGGALHTAEGCVVCRYYPGEDKWATLPPSPVRYFGVGQISGQLVLVGGKVASTKKTTGDLFVFVSESQQWEKSIPAMPTARFAPSVASHSTVLVVCGGRNDSNTPLPTVELYSSEASQWYQCPSLPFPRGWMSSVTISDTLFLVGGYDGQTMNSVKKSILSASLTTLVDALHHSSGIASTESLWTALEDVPYYYTAAASIGGCLLALGGIGKGSMWGFYTVNTVSDSIHVYLPTSSTWNQMGELPLPLSRTTAVLLPTNELLIIGGDKEYNSSKTKRVFKVTLQV